MTDFRLTACYISLETRLACCGKARLQLARRARTIVSVTCPSPLVVYESALHPSNVQICRLYAIAVASHLSQSQCSISCAFPQLSERRDEAVGNLDY